MNHSASLPNREKILHMKIRCQAAAALFPLIVSVQFCHARALQIATPATHWTEESFETRLIAGAGSDAENLIRSACVKTQAFDGDSYASCYTSDWAAWAKRLQSLTAPA